MDDASSFENELYDKSLRDQLGRLKNERRNSHIYQSVFSEAGAMDYGPEFESMSDDLVNDLYDKNKILDKKIKAIENQLDDSSNR